MTPEPGLHSIAAPPKRCGSGPTTKTMRLGLRNICFAFDSTFFNVNLRFLDMNLQRKILKR
jgi:hypothetical protein